MTLEVHSLIPFLAHKDDIVRKKVAQYFLSRYWVSEEVRDLAFESVVTFDFRDNLPVINLLEIQQLTTEQLRLLLNIYQELKMMETSSRVLAALKNIILNQPGELINSQDYLSLDFLGEVHYEVRQQDIYHDIFDLYLKRSSREIWEYLKKMHSQTKLDDESNWLKIQILLEVLVVKLVEDDVQIQEVRSEVLIETVEYFRKIAPVSGNQNERAERIDNSQIYFYLLIVDFFKIDVYQELFSLFERNLPQSLYEEIVITLSSFQDSKILSKASDQLALGKMSSQARKSFLSIFDAFPVEKSEEALMKLISQIKRTDAIYEDLLLKLADIFSLEFFELGKKLLNETLQHSKKKYLVKKNLLVYSIITGMEVPENNAFVDSYIKQSDQRELFSRERKRRMKRSWLRKPNE